MEIGIQATPWIDVRRAWELAEGSLRYADALYVAAAERQKTGLLTVDGRIARSGAHIDCDIITIEPGDGSVHGTDPAAPEPRGGSG